MAGSSGSPGPSSIKLLLTAQRPTTLDVRVTKLSCASVGSWAENIMEFSYLSGYRIHNSVGRGLSKAGCEVLAPNTKPHQHAWRRRVAGDGGYGEVSAGVAIVDGRHMWLNNILSGYTKII